MDHEKWKNVSQTLWNFVATAGLLAAGIWTLITFNALDAKNHARHEIEKLKAEEQELKERLKKASAVTASLSASVLTSEPTGARYVEVVARLRNSGTETAIMPFEGPAITLVRLEFGKDGIPRETQRHHGQVLVVGADTRPQTGLMILAGENRNCRAIVKVQEPGIYLATFFLMRPLHEQQAAWRQGMPRTEHAALFASQYIMVP
jgi:hypothetical protein